MDHGKLTLGELEQSYSLKSLTDVNVVSVLLENALVLSE